MNHIIIEGFMGSGKGSISKRVASELSLPIIDIDRKISERMKMMPSEIYSQFGDVYYRALETYILSELKNVKERSIIIIGSGLPTVPQSAAILKELGTVYYLKTDMSMIISRLDRGKKSDWLEENDDLRERVRKLIAEREPYYLEAADVVIEAKKRTVADIVQELVGLIREKDGGDEAADADAEHTEAEEKKEEEAAEAADMTEENPPEDAAGQEEKPSEEGAAPEEEAAQTEEVQTEESPAE